MSIMAGRMLTSVLTAIKMGRSCESSEIGQCIKSLNSVSVPNCFHAVFFKQGDDVIISSGLGPSSSYRYCSQGSQNWGKH